MRAHANAVPALDAWAPDRSNVEALAEEVRASGLYNSATASGELVLRLFGAPDARTKDRFAYNLVVLPDHAYEWLVDEGDRIEASSLVRRFNALRPTDAQARLGLRDKLEVGYHTEADVRNMMGPPLVEDGWWPEHTLTYTTSETKERWVFTFLNGLLVREDVRPG